MSCRLFAEGISDGPGWTWCTPRALFTCGRGCALNAYVKMVWTMVCEFRSSSQRVSLESSDKKFSFSDKKYCNDFLQISL